MAHAEKENENMTLYRALTGLGYIPDRNWHPMLKTLKGWQRHADQQARQRNKHDRMPGFWTGYVCRFDKEPELWPEYQEAPTVRINYVGMPHATLTR